jgi:hypothetical protein
LIDWRHVRFSSFILSQNPSSASNIVLMMLIQSLLVLALLQAATTIHGRVVDLATGQALQSVHVGLVLSDGGGTVADAWTDESGQYKFTNVQPGRYQLGANRDGYIPQNLQNLSISAGGQYVFSISLKGIGSIEGHIYDTNRQPARNASVQLLTSQFDNFGQRTLESGGAFIKTNDKTDDLGAFRFSEIPSGKYYLVANMDDSISYYPGVSQADDAIPIRLAAGAVVSSTDLTLNPLSRYKVSGRIVNPLLQGDKKPYEYRLIRRNARLRNTETIVKDRSEALDRFEFQNVAPGAYDLYIGYVGDAFSLNWGYAGHASFDLSDHDINDLTVTIEPGVRIDGEFRFDETASKTSTVSSELWLHFIGLDGMPQRMTPPVEPGYSGGRLGAAFHISHVARGRYRLEFTGPSNLYVSAAHLGMQDITGQTFEIDENTSGPMSVELSGAGATLQGTVTAEDGSPIAGADVWIVPGVNRSEDASSYASTRTDDQGQFKFSTIAPGMYAAFALASSQGPVQRGAVMNSEFITPYLSFGTPLDLAKGQTVHQDLKVIRIQP